MAINTTTRQTTAFTSGNNFSFQFKVYEVGDVKVIQIQTSNGAETVLTITTHYTVTLNDDQNANPGGTVTLVSSGSPQNLATGYNIVITSKVQPLQQTEITNQGGFFPEVINDVLDKAAILDQQQQAILDKTIRFPLTQTVGGLEITENASNRANKIPQFDGSGDLIIGLITNSGLAADSVNSSQLVDGSIDTQHIGNLQVDTSKLAADSVNSSKIQDNAIDSEHYVDGSIDRIHLEADIIDSSKLADNSVNSEHYVDGSIDHVHLSNDCVDGDNIADNSINSEHYVNGSIDNEHIADGTIQSSKLAGGISANQLANNSVVTAAVQDGQITSAKLHPDTVITSSEQAAATTNDTSFLTSAAADARFFNISTGDTIKDGQTFPDNDTSIATTAAINDRIIDLINDVGGFTIIESEQHFPDTNPQGTTGQAAVLSVKAASTDLVPSGTTVTINNGNLANNANITITGVPSTIPSGFGFLVESTGTIHEYAFHRLVPKATEVTSVAGKAVEIGRLGTADAVADMAILGTTDVVADMNMLATTDIVADMALLATTDVIADMNTLAVADVISDMDVVATNVSNVNNVGNNITNVNNLTNSVGANQTFNVTVQNVSGNKYFIDGVQAPVLKLARGKTYTFNLADSSNSGHPLAFRDGSDNAYTTGVTTNGTAGSSGATVVIVVAANAPNTLKYYCTSHGNSMGNTINVVDDNVGAVAGALTNIGNVAGALTNVNNVGGSIANVNTVASNLSSVNNFANQYRIGANNPTTSLDVGDLFYNTTSQSLKVYTGSAWVDGVTQTGNFALKTGNTFTGSNVHNDNVKSIFGTGSDLEIYHNGSDSIIDDVGTGTLKLQLGGATKLEIQSGGIGVTGNIAVSGNVDGRDVAADGTKLDGIESNATADQTGAQIKSLYEAESDTNAFTDALLTKLNGIAASATNVTNNNQLTNGAGYITATLTNEQVQDIVGNMVSGNTESGITVTYQDSDGTLDFSVTSQTDNNFTTTLKNKLDGIEASATADQTASEIVALVADQTIAPSEIDMEDNEKIKLGTGDDLEIYHDGSHSYIHDAGTGNLKIRSSRVDILNSAGDEDMIVAVENGQVELHYDNSKKLETQSAGINVTGQVECDEIYLKDSEKILLGASSDLQIFHDGSNSYFKDTGTGNLNITGSQIVLANAAFNENMITASENDSVDLFFNGVKKFETSAYGVYVIGGANGNYDSHNGGTVTFDFSSAAYHFVNMNSNSTFAAPINSQIGHSGSIFLTQDGTGGRTGSFNSAFKFVGGSAPTLSTGANAVDRLDFIVLDDSPLTVHVAVSLDVK